MWNPMMKKFVRGLGKTYQHTPDIAVIEDSEFKLVFVCDDMMRSHKNYKNIQDNSAQATRAFTKPKFDYRIKRDNGQGLPFLGKRSNQHQPLRIKGEVHAIQSTHIPHLDNLYRNGVLFYRIRVPLLVPYREHTSFYNKSEDNKPLPTALQGRKDAIGPDMVAIIEAYMYVAASKAWPDVDGGYVYTWAEIHEPTQPRPWLPQYYRYPVCINQK